MMMNVDAPSRLISRRMDLRALRFRFRFHRLRCKVQRPFDGSSFGNLVSKVSDARERRQRVSELHRARLGRKGAGSYKHTPSSALHALIGAQDKGHVPATCVDAVD